MEKVPEIVVWFTNIDFKGPLSVHVSADNATETGFTLQLDGGEKSILLSVGVGWLAYPLFGFPICSGSSNKEDWKSSQLTRSGRRSLGTADLTGWKTLVAINALDMGACKNLTLEAKATATFGRTRAGSMSTVEWEIEAGPEDLCLDSVGISYLVMK